MGGLSTVYFMPPFGGALVGAGASLLGSWVTEWHKRKSAEEEKERKLTEACLYLAPEFFRTSERVLYISDRARGNYITAYVGREPPKNGDVKEDFVPFHPFLFPSSPQVRDLPAEVALALVAYYDSLHELEKFVLDWWERPGQLRSNVFNVILHHADKSLLLAQGYIEKLEATKIMMPQPAQLSTLNSRIERSRASTTEARQHQLDRAKSGPARPHTNSSPSGRAPARS